MNVSNFTGFAPNRSEVSNYGLSDSLMVEEVRKWENIPKTAQAAENVLQIIKSEERESEDLSLSNTFIEEDGSINDMRMTQNALKKLCVLMDIKGANYLIHADSDIRQIALNREFSKRDLSLKFHTRKSGAKREIFSVTSTKFPNEGNSIEVIETLARDAKEDSRANFIYNANKASIKFEVLHQTFQNNHYSIGDPHKAGVSYLIRDAGFGSIKASFTTYRHACANMALLIGSYWDMPRIIHRGSLLNFRTKLDETFKLSSSYMDIYLRLNHLSTSRAAEHKTFGAVSELFANAAYNPESFFSKLTSFNELKPLQALNSQLQVAWQQEHSAPTWHAIINSITRVAREQDMEKKIQLESIAGNLLSKIA